jgi:poly-gamma-glutamate capsule biosynthesis protein CapA/YwtB (metallophosphatase superfamily)
LKRITKISGLLLFCIFLFSCATTVKAPKAEPVQIQQETIQKTEKNLTVLFGGDIMAHIENFRMKDYDLIWNDVAPDIKKNDLAFANLETPVDDKLDWHTYPTFNIHHEYADAAIKAGFNVLSLANNHTNHQGIAGIRHTEKWAKSVMSSTAESERPVYAAGLKDKTEDFSYEYFTVKGWRILFLPVTEILNSPAYSEYINYITPLEKNRTGFIRKVEELRKAHPCDLFIISIHCYEEEYIRTVKKSQREFYYALLDRGKADIIWANHPHVAKEWEILGKSGSNKLDKLIMYANGNTISGQRRNPQFAAPDSEHEYTGDGYLIQVIFSKTVYTNSSIPCEDEDTGMLEITEVVPLLITTYIDPSGNFIVKQLDDSFLQTLSDQGQKNWALYLSERKKIMEQIKGNIIWQ